MWLWLAPQPWSNNFHNKYYTLLCIFDGVNRKIYFCFVFGGRRYIERFILFIISKMHEIKSIKAKQSYKDR